MARQDEEPRGSEAEVEAAEDLEEARLTDERREAEEQERARLADKKREAEEQERARLADKKREAEEQEEDQAVEEVPAAPGPSVSAEYLTEIWHHFEQGNCNYFATT